MAAFERARRNRGKTSEPQLTDDIVTRLFQLLMGLTPTAERSTRFVETVNLTTVAIAPSQLCPTSPEGTFPDANKRIDYAFALEITDNEERTLDAAASKYRVPGEASINQTYGRTAFKPMFANVEIKVDDRDPLIQMGTWVAAEYTKRDTEGYPMDIPIPAIIIDGDEWAIYIACSLKVPMKKGTQNGKGFEIRILGPVRMGNTQQIRGIFKIIYMLKAVVKWGLEVYEPKYFMKVFGKYKRKS
ncbi:MAG: hypothetical protein Q9220_007756 [cf. Caloplaca sp. 1 TL-2023]